VEENGRKTTKFAVVAIGNYSTSRQKHPLCRFDRQYREEDVFFCQLPLCVFTLSYNHSHLPVMGIFSGIFGDENQFWHMYIQFANASSDEIVSKNLILFILVD
jgi:hypothetical protein